MDIYEQVTNAILLLGHKPDENGHIQKGVEERAKLAASLYFNGVAPVIIPSGWYWPKDSNLAQFCEAEVMANYLRQQYPNSNINLILEPFSTSVPENLLFTWAMFPNLQEITIVTGELFVKRTRFLAHKIFGNRVHLAYAGCRDRLSSKENEDRLLANLQCIFKGDEPCDPEFLRSLFLSPLSDGTWRSKWLDLNEYHYDTCPIHRRPTR